MLGKLIKYEMKAMGRVMLPVYVLLLASAGAFAAYIHMSVKGSIVSSFLERFSVIFVVVFFLVSFAAAVMMAVLVIQRFYKNLLGSEGYLMFTLPATTGQHLLSKGIAAFIWILLGGIAGSACGLMLILSTGSYSLSEFINDLVEVSNTALSLLSGGNRVQGTILLVIMGILSICYMLAKVYAALAIGHLWSSHRLLGGVLAYIVIGIAEILIRRFIHLEDLLQNTGNAGAMAYLVLSLAGTLVCYGIAWYILDRKLNLE